MRTLAGPAEHAEEIKNSRFIARAAPVDSVQAATDFIARVGEPAATHNCWAYRLGDAYRFSDDGEPGGTAGKPILGAIDRSGFDAVAVVVTRYFGGVKLGAGGLARAYGGVAASCLRLAESVEVVPRVRLRIRAGFDAAGRLHAVLERHSASKCAEDFTPDGVELVVEIDDTNRAAFEDALRDATSGAVDVQPDSD